MELVSTVSKDQHGLSSSDINDTDKMKFRPVEKMTEDRVVNCLQQVAGSEATAIFLQAIRKVMTSYMDSTHTPLQKVYDIW